MSAKTISEKEEFVVDPLLMFQGILIIADNSNLNLANLIKYELSSIITIH